MGSNPTRTVKIFSKVNHFQLLSLILLVVLQLQRCRCELEINPKNNWRVSHLYSVVYYGNLWCQLVHMYNFESTTQFRDSIQDINEQHYDHIRSIPVLLQLWTVSFSASWVVQPNMIFNSKSWTVGAKCLTYFHPV